MFRVRKRKIPFRLDENNWKLILTKPSSRLNFSSTFLHQPCMTRVCERTSRSSWQSLAAVEAPEPKQPLFTSHFFYMLDSVCLPSLLMLVAVSTWVGKWKKGHIKEEEKVRHTHIDFLPTFGFAHFPCRNKRAHQQQHGAWVWCWLWMVKMKKQQSACVRGWMRQKLRSRILMLQNLRVAENLFADHQRMPIEIKSLELGVIIVVTVSRLSSTSSSFEGNSRDLQQKTWKEVVGVALKEEAAILISFALSHKMMIVITSHTRFHSFTRKGISSLGALEGDESAENSSFKLLSQTSESFFTRICTQIIDWLLRNSEINIA